MNILNTLTKKELSSLVIKEYRKDDVLFYELDKCKKIGVVIVGELVIRSYLDDGTVVIYNQIKENESFGQNLIFSDSPIYKGNIVALKNSKIIYIEKNQLLKLLKNNEKFMIEYLKNQSDFTKTLNERIKLLSLNSAKDRLLFYLYSHNNEIKYESISALSEQLFLQRETLSRLVNKLAKQKKIFRNENIIKLI